jgi:anti-sigma factor RsiW
MTVSPETLLAFVEGELSAEEAQRVAAEVANDPGLAAHVENHLALKARLKAASPPASGPVDTEGMAVKMSEIGLLLRASGPAGTEGPAMATSVAEGSIVPQPSVAESEAKPGRRVAASWIPAVTMAAGIGLGLLVAISLRPDTEIRGAPGGVVAEGMLARALSTVIAMDKNGAAFAPNQIGESFFSSDGYFCRNFSSAAGKSALAGIACREGDEWRIRVLANSEPSDPEKNGNKAPPLPAPVRETLNALMVGEPLDADGERAARAQSWLVH